MKKGFSRFLGADPDRLHAAAHSHHPWPDVTYDAHMRAWEDAARLADDKWDSIFARLLPSVRSKVAAVLGLGDPETVVFAPNTHELVVRVASNLARPFRVLTTDSEFHSFARQVRRWEEAGIARADRVPARPFATFGDRLVDAYDGQDLVLFSHVHFNSAYVTPELPALVDSFPEPSLVVVDGYHGFLALPTDLSPVADRAFYVAGGYKYAMAGEGACFMHVPPSAPSRPVDTGWFAGFGALTENPDAVPYATGGQRYAGATADHSGLYRLEAVLAWLEREGVSTEQIHGHVTSLQRRLLGGLPASLVSRLLAVGEERGHFLAFELDDAAGLYHRLHRRKVITDYRADRWRVGLGIYHDEDDIDRLADEIGRALAKGE